jgi:hypothetical protein
VNRYRFIVAEKAHYSVAQVVSRQHLTTSQKLGVLGLLRVYNSGDLNARLLTLR